MNQFNVIPAAVIENWNCKGQIYLGSKKSIILLSISLINYMLHYTLYWKKIFSDFQYTNRMSIMLNNNNMPSAIDVSR